ncbi:hypothetical protein [Rhizobium sp. BK068]|uniref:hypothetical protein n=1 Tax=Rhizobium sp. BK068 TaxID=2512130 RepID=UPI0010D46769|nr:hypothetical protein [Rhizobium sp. BK068]TCM64530.1 hypothetical protein EV291_1453 [Rhizobium sp. BK068]
MSKKSIGDDGVTDSQAGMNHIPDLSENGVSLQPVQARTIALVVAVAFFMQAESQ